MDITNQIILLNKLLNEEINTYKGLSTSIIKEKLSIQKKSKNINSVIFNKIIDKSSNKERIKSLLTNCNCILKTVNLERNNTLKESMSLNVFKFCDIIHEAWDSSTLRNYFSKNVFVFIVLKKRLSDSTLEEIKLWKMPEDILDGGVKDTWVKTKELILNGKIVNYIDDRGRKITFFPTISETKYIHVRPHAQNSNDTIPLPVEDKLTHAKEFTKHSFWLNSNFVKKIVVEDKFYD